MKKLLSLTLAAAVFSATPSVFAQFAKNEDAVKYRQSAFTVMAHHFGRLGAMANDKMPYDAKSAAESADIVASMSKLPWLGFVPGADSPKAKAEIWSNAGHFKEAAEKLQAEAAKLATAAKVGNVAALKSAFGPTAGTCKGCHDDFRNK